MDVIVRERMAGIRPSRTTSTRGPAWLVAGWAVLVIVAFGLGYLLRRAGRTPLDALPPLHAEPRLLIVSLWPAALVALAAVVALPRAATVLGWRRLLVVSWLVAVAWAVALAISDGGVDALTRPVLSPHEYLAVLPAVGDTPVAWLRGFTEALPEYPIHVKGHPPGGVLILWGLRWIGLTGAGWAAAFIIAAGSSAGVAIAITLRKLSGEAAARRALPFLVLTPAVVWVATSMDALFLGITAWGIALLAMAVDKGSGDFRTSPSKRRQEAARPPGNPGEKLWITFPLGAVTCAFTGGLLLGMIPYLSYGLLPLFAIPLAVLIATRPSRLIVIAALAGAIVVPAAFTVAGFWWFDGVSATHDAWAYGAGSDRPYNYYFLGNLAALALLTGPATAAALAAVHRTAIEPGLIRRAYSMIMAQPLAVAALIGVLALDLSGVTRGEVERIWLPYAAWIVTVNACHKAPARGWLAAQVAVALALQALMRSPW